MTLELILRFTGIDRVAVKFDDVEADVNFQSPLSEDDLKELRWYVESYSSGYTADVDDLRAERVQGRLKGWGEALYKAVFHGESIEPFLSFRNLAEAGRVVTIQSSNPAVLSLPWELLQSPQGGYLFNEKPRISIRRNLAQRGGRAAQKVEAKERLRLLFVLEERALRSGWLLGFAHQQSGETADAAAASMGRWALRDGFACLSTRFTKSQIVNTW